MKKYICLLFLSLLLGFHAQAQPHHPFKMRGSQLAHYLPINSTFSAADSICLDSVNVPIEGLSVTGRLVQPYDSSFVRILLEDTLGVEYVVLESSRRYNDVDTLMLDDYCMETSVLLDVVPRMLYVFISNAEIQIDSVKYITHEIGNGNSPHHIAVLDSALYDVRREQAVEIANSINEYNQSHQYVWIADTTGLALLPWRERKLMMDLEDDSNGGGLEYYVGGIFEFPRKSIDSWNQRRDSIWNAQLKNSPYVEQFDWRDRHGKNWITPAKQQHGNTCWAFSAIGALESVVNLYYNQLINMDLSEQELIMCSRVDSINPNDILALQWIVNNGVMDDASYPYQPGESGCNAPDEYEECVSFHSYRHPHLYGHYPDSLKHYLIEKGPLTATYATGEKNGHAVVLVGYNVIREGDIFRYATSDYQMLNVVVTPDYPHIGETYWIFKNSYAETSPGYILMYAPRKIFCDAAYLNTPITSMNYIDDDIVCEDSDGDGYYFWGIGPKPSHCPAWVPDEPDGDDSDDTKGAMNEYGYLYDLVDHINDTVYINTDTVWNQKKYMYSHVVIQNGARLTINNDVTFYKSVTMNVREGGTLLLDGGRLLNADVKIDEMSGSTVRITNNGKIERRTNHRFYVPLGNQFKMDYGKIQ